MLCTAFSASAALAAPQLYSGSMKIIATSGRSCGTVAAEPHPMTLVLERRSGGEISGYFEGEVVSLGKFSGNDPQHLIVSYPYPDQQRASGHSMSLRESAGKLLVELHDRHVEAEVDECNFDVAEMTFQPKQGESAEQAMQQIQLRFEAHLLRSEAFALGREGSYFAATDQYQKALEKADRAYPVGSTQLNAYSVALAGSLMKTGRVEDFNRLYDQRYATLGDEANRAIFNFYRVRALQTIARTAAKREDYDGALKSLKQAYQLQPLDRGTVVAMLAAYMHAGRFSDALEFLEGAEKTAITPEDRRDLNGAKATILLKLADIADKKGNPGEAEKWLGRAMALDPLSVQYSVAMARLRHKTGSLEEAEQLLDQSQKKFQDPSSQEQIQDARQRMRQTDLILRKLRQAGS